MYNILLTDVFFKLSCDLKADEKEGKVPENFWENLKNGYRKYPNGASDREENLKAFEYFVDRILPCINKAQTHYDRQKKNGKLISNVFTVSDEALAIILVENYHQRWHNQCYEPNKEKWRTEKKFKAKYTSSDKGSREQSWSKEGIASFFSWCEKVKKLCEAQDMGIDLENQMAEKYKRHNGCAGFSGRSKRRFQIMLP